jgi:hypothetical protein
MALARRHAVARPDALGFLYAGGHARVYYGTRTVQKTHVARLKFPAPATMETWVTDRDGDPVFMVVAEPSDSLAGELRRLLPQLRQVAGEGRRVTVCFDRGGWSPALFADITAAGFDVLTWRKGPMLPTDRGFGKLGFCIYWIKFAIYCIKFAAEPGKRDNLRLCYGTATGHETLTWVAIFEIVNSMTDGMHCNSYCALTLAGDSHVMCLPAEYPSG